MAPVYLIEMSQFPHLLADVTCDLQQMAICWYLDPERRDTDKEAFMSAVRHRGIHCRCPSVTHSFYSLRYCMKPVTVSIYVRAT